MKITNHDKIKGHEKNSLICAAKLVSSTTDFFSADFFFPVNFSGNTGSIPILHEDPEKKIFAIYEDKNSLYAVNIDTGKKRWSFKLPSEGKEIIFFKLSPDNKIYLSDGRTIYCLDVFSGSLIDKFIPTDKSLSKSINENPFAIGLDFGKDGTIFVKFRHHNGTSVHAYLPHLLQNPIWKYHNEDSSRNLENLSVSNDGRTLFINSHILRNSRYTSYSLFAVDASTEKEIWFKQGRHSPVTQADDGTLFVYSGNLEAFDGKSGLLKWAAKIQSFPPRSYDYAPLIGDDKNIYLLTNNNRTIECFNPDGEFKFKINIGNLYYYFKWPIIVKNKMIYAAASQEEAPIDRGSKKTKLFVFDSKDGRTIASKEIDKEICTHLFASEDGYIYIGVRGGIIRSFCYNLSAKKTIEEILEDKTRPIPQIEIEENLVKIGNIVIPKNMLWAKD